MHNINESAVQEQIESLGAYIGEEIKNRKMSKKGIAEQAGFSVNTINNVVSGRNATMHSILTIAWILGMNINDLVEGATAFASIPDGPGIPKETGPVPSQQAIALNVNSSEQTVEQTKIRMGIS